MLLEQVKNINAVDEELEKEYNDLFESISTFLEDMGMSASGGRMPQPGMADDEVSRQEFPEDQEVEKALNDVVTQMKAAQKAMGMLNQMADSEFRTKHRSRVMGNLNRIRGSFQRVMKMIPDTSDRGGKLEDILKEAPNMPEMGGAPNDMEHRGHMRDALSDMGAQELQKIADDPAAYYQGEVSPEQAQQITSVINGVDQKTFDLMAQSQYIIQNLENNSQDSGEFGTESRIDLEVLMDVISRAQAKMG